MSVADERAKGATVFMSGPTFEQDGGDLHNSRFIDTTPELANCDVQPSRTVRTAEFEEVGTSAA